MYMDIEIQEIQAIEWFKERYGLKDFKFTMRKFKPYAIIQNDKRYKVVDIYPVKIDGFYFVIYSRKPSKEKGFKGFGDGVFGDPTVEHTVRITHTIRN